MNSPNENFKACMERARALPEEVRNRLQPVPTVPYEAFLMWDPEDLKQDRPLTFYRKLKTKRCKGELIYDLPVAKVDAHYTSRLHGSKNQPQYRRKIVTTYKRKFYNFYCSHLTMLCIFQFKRENPRINVVEHLNGDSTDDRPSNLLLSTQSVNCRRSEKHREQARKSIEAINARRRAERERLLAEPRAVNVASAYPEIEKTVDLQIELQLDTFLQQIYDPLSREIINNK